MLNPQLKLNTKFFGKDTEMAPIRKGFGEGLLEVAKKDARVVGLCADLTESTYMHLFKKEFPERFVEIGVAEQNLASVASGMSAMGKIPVISSYAVFSPGRNWEQIRTTICLNNRKVIIAGSHGGVSVGPDGATHQALEDIAIMRALPNMAVLTPCDATEAKKAIIEAVKWSTPVYIRLAREKTPIMTTYDTPFEIGKAETFFSSPSADGNKQIGIIAGGTLLSEALWAGKELADSGMGVEVVNIGTIKPIDKDAILRLAERSAGIVTVEEHQASGGLGGAVAEVLSEHYPLPMRFVAVKNVFGQSGRPDELIRHYGLDKESIKRAVRELEGG